MQVVGMDHIVVNVSDVEEALRFYGGVLGMEVLREDQFRRGDVGFVSVRASGGTILDLRPSQESPGGPVNIDHFCLVVDTEDIDATLEELRAQGVEIAGPMGTRWGAKGDGRSFFITGPDGNKIELKCYTG